MSETLHNGVSRPPPGSGDVGTGQWTHAGDVDTDHRCTASQNAKSQPWNTTISPMKRTPGNCRASRSSAR